MSVELKMSAFWRISRTNALLYPRK